MPLGFQPGAFQQNAFQTAYGFVASTYSLGALDFAAPALTVHYVFSAPTYDLGALDFAAPPLTASTITLHANAYSLGALSFDAVSIRQIHQMVAADYSLGSPSFATPTWTQKHVLFANPMAVEGLDFGEAHLFHNYQLHANGYSVGSPEFATPPTTRIFPMYVDDYTLGNPRFGFPRMEWEVVEIELPPTYLTQAEEAAQVLVGLLDHILMAIPPGRTPERDILRRLVGILRSNAQEAIRGDTLGTQLGEIYTAADAASATYAGMEMARQYLMSQVASKSLLTQILFRSALIMTLGLQSKVIGRMTFTTQHEIQNMIRHMRDAFDAAKAIGIDEVDALVYQTINAMGGALINHLATIELQLPRFVIYTTQIPMPSLYLANRIYADPSRYIEIEDENDVVHPAFCPVTIRVLSNAGRSDSL